MISYLKVITVIRGQVMSDIVLPSKDVVNDTILHVQFIIGAIVLCDS